MKKQKLTLSVSGNALKFSKKIILLLTFGASGISLLLSIIYQMLIANLGTDSAFIYIFSYISEAVSVCFDFCLAGTIIYAILSKDRQSYVYSIVMHPLSLISISVILNALLTWLIAFINEHTDLPFDISNYTLRYLEGTQLIYIVSMSFLSVISIFVIILLSTLINRRVLKKYEKERIDLSLEALANTDQQANPLYKPCLIFVAVFTVFSFAFSIYDTVNTIITSGAPRLITEYIYLITPYFVLLIYILAGFFAMQYFLKFYSNKILELSK